MLFLGINLWLQGLKATWTFCCKWENPLGGVGVPTPRPAHVTWVPADLARRPAALAHARLRAAGWGRVRRR